MTKNQQNVCEVMHRDTWRFGSQTLAQRKGLSSCILAVCYFLSSAGIWSLTSWLLNQELGSWPNF